MKGIFLSVFVFVFSEAFAECGVYRLTGVFHPKTPLKDSLYTLNGDSKSQRNLSFNSIFDLNRMGTYKDMTSVIEVEMTKPMDATKGEIAKVISMKPGLSHPLQIDPDKSMQKIKELPCQK